jgi:hypothetical protein
MFCFNEEHQNGCHPIDYVLGIIAVIGIVILCVNTLLVILSMGAGIL